MIGGVIRKYHDEGTEYSAETAGQATNVSQEVRKTIRLARDLLKVEAHFVDYRGLNTSILELSQLHLSIAINGE